MKEFVRILKKTLKEFQEDGPKVAIVLFERGIENSVLYAVYYDLPFFLESDACDIFQDKLVNNIRSAKLKSIEPKEFVFRFFDYGVFTERIENGDPELLSLIQNVRLEVLEGDDLLKKIRIDVRLTEQDLVFGSVNDMMISLRETYDRYSQLQLDLFRLFMNGLRVYFDLDLKENDRSEKLLNPEYLEAMLDRMEILEKKQKYQLTELFVRGNSNLDSVDLKLQAVLDFTEKILIHSVEWLEAEWDAEKAPRLIQWADNMILISDLFNDEKKILNSLFKIITLLENNVTPDMLWKVRDIKEKLIKKPA